MMWWEYGLVAMMGMLIGSFLNVVIYRVPRNESVIRPRSSCPQCGIPISARDNIPVLSWLLLRGRSRCCDLPISMRYPMVEIATGLMCVLVLWGAQQGRYSWPGVVPMFYLAFITVALSMIDLDVYRLPNAIVLPSYIVGFLLIAGATAVEPKVNFTATLLRVAVGASAAFTWYALLAVVYPAGMGFGDVKLAGVLGAYLVWLGWSAWIVGLMGAFFIGGLVTVVLLTTGRATRKTAIPFGPMMFAGAWVSILAHAPLVTWYMSVTGMTMP